MIGQSPEGSGLGPWGEEVEVEGVEMEEVVEEMEEEEVENSWRR